MSLSAVLCESCGGAVALELGQRVPACLFCGAETLIPTEVPEGIEVPEVHIPFKVDDDAARTRFKKFASSSIWYPGDLRHAKLDLNRILLPAWDWSGTIETHFAALVPAATRSGKRPATGDETVTLKGVLVPSSTALRRAELTAISPFDAGDEQPFVDEDVSEPYELGSLTRSAARAQAMTAFRERHSGQIKKRIRASRMSAACLYADMAGRPLLLPVYIGAYRRGKTLHRVVINGQSGKLTGKAPISWARVGCAIVLVVMMLFFCMGVVGVVGAVSR